MYPELYSCFAVIEEQVSEELMVDAVVAIFAYNLNLDHNRRIPHNQ